MAEALGATMNDVVDGFARLLAAGTTPVVAVTQVGARRPAQPGDLPFVAVALELDEPRGRGLGRLIEGERPGARLGDPPLGERPCLPFTGLAALELWAASDRTVTDGARRIGERLADRAATRQHGFLRLEPARLAPAEHATRPASAGSDFSAWSQRLEYRFHFELATEPEDGGGIIGRVDVDMSHLPDPGPEDHLVIPADART
jgi:hypothetical protein